MFDQIFLAEETWRKATYRVGFLAKVLRNFGRLRRGKRPPARIHGKPPWPNAVELFTRRVEPADRNCLPTTLRYSYTVYGGLLSITWTQKETTCTK